ncbi:DMT family transporter [Desulfogranum mediterraneum]|uniref:DMT family transporter n=1 Tax=Desulfogranum mediterraneum TaxID=160661 RepID=UPI0004207F1B|nr:DMT family transporter [Desulfogranum mediterraneum]
MHTQVLAVNRLSRQQLLGWTAVFGSAFCFYLATLIIRWSQPYVAIDTSFFVFSRFLLGFVAVCLTMAWKREPLRPSRYHYLLGRTVANCIAVFCFYKAVEVASVAEANILNMTYPLFVALFSWVLIREQRDGVAVGIVLIAFVGVWMVLAPSGAASGVGTGLHNIWGFTSGFTAAFAIIYLNLSRKYHSSQTILFFMFGLGALIMALLFHRSLFLPNPRELFFLFSCSVAGVAGQYLLTYGFLYVTAVEGAVISSTRILLAAILGPLLVADPMLSLSGWFGALLIFSANVSLARRRARLAH